MNLQEIGPTNWTCINSHIQISISRPLLSHPSSYSLVPFSHEGSDSLYTLLISSPRLHRISALRCQAEPRLLRCREALLVLTHILRSKGIRLPYSLLCISPILASQHHCLGFQEVHRCLKQSNFLFPILEAVYALPLHQEDSS